MSVGDIATIFREETRVFLLFPSVAHGYLYHTNGNLLYIILATIALITPSMSFCFFYIHEVGDLVDYTDYWEITIGRVSATLAIFYGILGLIHMGSIVGLVLHMDHTDYIHVFLFLSSIFLVLITFWTGYYRTFLEKVKVAQKISPTERIDSRIPTESDNNED